MTKTLGKVLADARRLRKKTQGEVGSYLGVSRSAVAQYESDAITPTVTGLKELCRFLQISLGDAVDGVLKPLDDLTGNNRDDAGAENLVATHLFSVITDHVQKQVLFHPTPTQTLEWLARKSGILKPDQN